MGYAITGRGAMQYTDGVINLSSERCCGSYPIIFIPTFFSDKLRPMVFSIPIFGEGLLMNHSFCRWKTRCFRSVDEINRQFIKSVN